MESSEAYALGCDARNDIKPVDDNPYPIGSADRWEWARGWCDTDHDIKEAEREAA